MPEGYGPVVSLRSPFGLTFACRINTLCPFFKTYVTTPATTPCTTASRRFLHCEDPFAPQLTITYQFRRFNHLSSDFSAFAHATKRYRFRVVFSLEVDDPQIPARIPTRGTQDTTRIPWLTLRTITLFGTPFQRFPFNLGIQTVGLLHHISLAGSV